MVPTLRNGVWGIIPEVTEPVGTAGEPVGATEHSPYFYRSDGPSALGQAVAVTVIAAGVVFIVAVIFFAGVFLGGYRGGDDGDGWRSTGQMCPMGKPGTCPMMGGGEMMGPNSYGPGRMAGPGPSSPVPPCMPRP